jgi:hypothetical protein
MATSPKLSPVVLSFLFAPFGLLLFALGVYIGITGRLEGRSGAVIHLEGPWGWIVGGFYIALGTAIFAAPLYYLWRQRSSKQPTDSDRQGREL